MTRLELNKAIVSILYGEKWWHKDGDVFIEKLIGYEDEKVEFDPCNNWNDLMPQLLKHCTNIYIDKCDNECEVEWMTGEDMHSRPLRASHAVKNKNPQRALALCLLEVLKEMNK